MSIYKVRKGKKQTNSMIYSDNTTWFYDGVRKNFAIQYEAF